MTKELFDISTELDDVARVLKSTMQTAYLAFESYYSDAQALGDAGNSKRMLMYGDAIDCTTERVEMETERLRELVEKLNRQISILYVHENGGAEE